MLPFLQYLCDPWLVSLQCNSVPFIWENPKPDVAFQVSSLLLSRWEGLPPSTAVSQDTICLLYKKMAQVELGVHQDPHLPSWLFSSQVPPACAVHWGALPQVQHFALHLEFHYVIASSSLCMANYFISLLLRQYWPWHTALPWALLHSSPPSGPGVQPVFNPLHFSPIPYLGTFSAWIVWKTVPYRSSGTPYPLCSCHAPGQSLHCKMYQIG